MDGVLDSQYLNSMKLFVELAIKSKGWENIWITQEMIIHKAQEENKSKLTVFVERNIQYFERYQNNSPMDISSSYYWRREFDYI